jgi:tetratricopeptide (TPR) repeat protein
MKSPVTRSQLICALAISLGLQAVLAFGQTRPGQRLKHAVKERRESIQAQQLVDEGAQLLREGNARLAAEKFRRALQLDPDNDRAHAYAAQIAWNDRHSEAARRHAEMALKSNPKNARAQFVMGQILLREGRPLAAFDYLRKAASEVSDEPENAEAKKLLSRLREDHPEWFGRSRPVPAAVTKPAEPIAPKSETTALRPPNLAVFTFDEANPQSRAQGWGESIAEMLATALINSGRCRVIERKQLHKVLEEQALGQTGALDSETAVAVGKIMGLDAVVVGSITKLASALETDARVLNVETGEAVAAAHSRGASSDDLRKMAEALAQSIVSHADSIPIRTVPDTSDSLKQ